MTALPLPWKKEEAAPWLVTAASLIVRRFEGELDPADMTGHDTRRRAMLTDALLLAEGDSDLAQLITAYHHAAPGAGDPDAVDDACYSLTELAEEIADKQRAYWCQPREAAE